MQLVVLLYEQVLLDLRRAIEALRDGRVEERTRHLNHTILVLAHLQTSLNRERGGVVARNLNTFYDVARCRLIEAQCHASEAILQEQLTHFGDLRNAWQVAERAERASNPARAPSIGQLSRNRPIASR